MLLNDKFNQEKPRFNGEKFVGGLFLVIFISLLLFGSTDIETPIYDSPSI